MEKASLTFEDIIGSESYSSRIDSVSSIEAFTEWWHTQIYHKVPLHKPSAIDKVITRFERFAQVDGCLQSLLSIETEHPELYSPKQDRYYGLTPDTYGEQPYRLSEFSAQGDILRHIPFDSRAEALQFAAKQGCNQERPGSIDDLMGSFAFDRSLAKYAIINEHGDLNVYLRTTTDPEHRRLFADELAALAQAGEPQNKPHHPPQPKPR